jgi:hypothetical protein
MAEAAATQAAEEPARLVRPITIDRMKQAENVAPRWVFVLPAGIEPDDILPVAYWSHTAAIFKAALERGAYDIELIVIAEDKSWRGELLVVDAGVNWARVVFKTIEGGKRFITKLGGLQAHKIVLLPGHTVNFGGIFAKWRVVRDADGAVLRDKCNTEGDAYAWLSDYAKTVQPR